MRTGFFCLLLSALVLISCSEKRSAPAKSPQAESVSYSFPHQKDWGATHAEYFLKQGPAIANTRQDCSRCHNQLPRPQSLNVTCALSCHQPSTAESRGDLGLPKPFPVAKNQCLRCHSDSVHQTGQLPHFPAAAGLCTTCHTVEADHFESGAKKFVSTKPFQQSCYACHAAKDTHKSIHPALQLGEQACTSCHDPHGSDQKRFLKAEVGALCTTCHESHNGKSIHGAEKVGKSCVNCHDPHSADQPRMLKKPLNDLCLTCHDKDMQTKHASSPRVIPNIKSKMESSFPHTGAMGECTTCHSPHASESDRLLNDHYLTEDGEPGETTKSPPYGLCMKCHDSSLLKETEFGTGFRQDSQDGGSLTQMNLHNFHVVQMGKSCRNCHDPHGSNQDFHLRETSLDSDQRLIFKRQEKGGTCANACHEEHTYRRLDSAK